MLSRVLYVGLVAGVVAGLLTAVVQHFTTTPLIIAAEAYEGTTGDDATTSSFMPSPAGPLHGLVLTGAADAMHTSKTFGGAVIRVHTDEDGEAWAPADGFERTAWTSIATIVMTTGYALMLVSLVMLTDGSMTWRSGVAWGAAGFVATGLAPALGLSPELPGTAAAGIVDRQIWWLVTVIASGLGLWAVLRIATPVAIVVGILLLAVPHVVGAPHAAELTNSVPAELAATFSSTVLGVMAISWALIGGIAGYLWERDDARLASAAT
ncbi:MAG: CbtA family protein [Pseudomonadota bacterium]